MGLWNHPPVNFYKELSIYLVLSLLEVEYESEG